MAYSKKTIRHLGPQARKFARMVNELESTTRRLKNFMAYLQDMELDAAALANMRLITVVGTPGDPPDLDNDAALQALVRKYCEPEEKTTFPFCGVDAGEERP